MKTAIKAIVPSNMMYEYDMMEAFQPKYANHIFADANGDTIVVIGYKANTTFDYIYCNVSKSEIGQPPVIFKGPASFIESAEAWHKRKTHDLSIQKVYPASLVFGDDFEPWLNCTMIGEYLYVYVWDTRYTTLITNDTAYVDKFNELSLLHNVNDSRIVLGPKLS